ncbi:hypothetical protein [Priestia aryabhattai]|uniref:hypothetical protein n=1 Tax=Priestia aryabhattai TaxID=412384 RepID=UPI003D2803AD
MSYHEELVTPLLISVQDFAFRGRPVSLLVASATAAAFPAGVSVFPSNQQLEAANYILETYAHHSNKKIRTITRSDLPSTKILLAQSFTLSQAPSGFS